MSLEVLTQHDALSSHHTSGPLADDVHLSQHKIVMNKAVCCYLWYVARSVVWMTYPSEGKAVIFIDLSLLRYARFGPC